MPCGDVGWRPHWDEPDVEALVNYLVTNDLLLHIPSSTLYRAVYIEKECAFFLSPLDSQNRPIDVVRIVEWQYAKHLRALSPLEMLALQAG